MCASKYTVFQVLLIEYPQHYVKMLIFGPEMKKVLISTLLILFSWSSYSFCQDTAATATWFPKGNLYPTIRLDYRESQIYGSVYAMYASNQWQNRVFGNFSVGLRSNIIRWHHAPKRASELGFELSVFPQFIFNDPFGQLETSLFDVEFKIGLHYQYRLDHWRFRGRLYHISAHLGDDYLFRNGIDAFIDNPRIYEVVDFSVAWVASHWQIYATSGIIIHSAYERKPFLGQTGVQFVYPIGKKNWLRWVSGVNVNIEQEQDFRPGIRISGGIGMGKKGRFPVTIMADYYNGYMPYSLYNNILIQWIGATMWFSPFRTD